jgi:O-succinylbenzoic acid--CoA ligase
MNNTNYAYGGEMPDWLAARAALTPDRIALMVGDQRVTFGELDRRATSVARRLAGLGLRAGDRVAVFFRGALPMAELVHGVARAGAVLVPLNIRLAPAELAWQIQDVRARLLLFDCPLSLAEERGDGGVRALHIDDFYQQCESDFVPCGRIDLSSVHTIIYTSGTTGRPKGAMLTYGNHWWSAMGSVLNLGLREDDRWLAPLPLFHVGGLSILMRSVIYGIPAIVHERFDPAAVNRAIDDDGATIISVVAVQLRRMLDARGEQPYPSTLRHVLLGGGPAPLPLLEECARRGVPVVQTYGLTETASQAVTLAPSEALRKVGSAGKPLLPMEVRVEQDGRTAEPGQPGEIVVRGPTVTPGYVDRSEETARAIRGGWLHTGDLGLLDAEGYLYVLDRRDDLIVSGGENVYPAEIEATLLAHPAVVEAGVVGVDDSAWGQTPVAYVVPRPDLSVTPDALITFCRERLARYKVPARVTLVDALPRNASGKLLRRELRER